MRVQKSEEDERYFALKKLKAVVILDPWLWRQRIGSENWWYSCTGRVWLRRAA